MAKEIWVTDSETDPFDGMTYVQPFIWGAFNGDEYHEFYTTDKLVEFFSDKDVIVYAHNGGKFDYFFLLDYFDEFTPLMVIAGRMAKFKIGQAEFRDSINILPFSLDTYKKTKVDYSIFAEGEREKPENMRTIRNYLKDDCVYLYEIVKRFIDDYGLHMTQAGAAMKIWAKMANVSPPKTSKAFYDEFTPYYYGGRVQAFEVGEIKRGFQVIDINSAYPFAMMHRHPYGDVYSVSKALPRSREKTQRAFIKLRGVARGCFPYRAEDGSLGFPDDRVVRTYHVTGWEYLAAVKTKTLGPHEVLEVTRFIDSIEFVEYVNRFFKLKGEAKLNNDKAGYLFAKIFLNALYGKFAANPDDYKEYELIHPRFIVAAHQNGQDFVGELGPLALVQSDLPEEKQHYYNVAVAASITGFVRAYQWEAINQCEGVIYCDTDSIACESTGTLEIDPGAIGAWDVEANCDYGAIGGKKMYAFHDRDNDEWKTASKGVRLEPEEIIRVAQGEEVTYNPLNPSYSVKNGVRFQSRTVKRQQQ